MKCAVIVFAALCLTVSSQAQTAIHDIEPSQLQTVLSLPLDQAVKARETYKAPLKAAYEREMALAGKDCKETSDQGQQPYNACMGKAGMQAQMDYTIFYNNLQMLCHDQNQLTALQIYQKAWTAYRENAMSAALASWPNGSGAPGFYSLVYLKLVRDSMQELATIYDLNISH
jgi:uncharacterized protein YecT (DUF1311 family)